MKVLYQADLLKSSPEEVIKSYQPDLENDDFSFFLSLVTNVWEKNIDINNVIENISMEWRMDRMAVVDRNIMRMAVYEMLFCDDIPLSVAIDEAVEIAKTFAGVESAKFINGVIGEIAKSPKNFSEIAAKKLR
jgi:N utilization substance protein B